VIGMYHTRCRICPPLHMHVCQVHEVAAISRGRMCTCDLMFSWLHLEPACCMLCTHAHFGFG
jgi:hypothetical protein